jgi:hypothetical protein
MKNTIIRESNGRILGRLDEFWNDEDDNYFDHKVDELYFPNHNQYDASPVTITYINKN